MLRSTVLLLLLATEGCFTVSDARRIHYIHKTRAGDATALLQHSAAEFESPAFNHRKRSDDVDSVTSPPGDVLPSEGDDKIDNLNPVSISEDSTTTAGFDIFTDVCAARRCRPGRVCRPRLDGREADCVCGGEESCVGPRHRARPVCGSDGRWYPNHCELHRTACVTGEHLHVDHRPNACQKESGTTEKAATTTLPTTIMPTVSSYVDPEYGEIQVEVGRDGNGDENEDEDGGDVVQSSVLQSPPLISPQLGIVKICSGDHYDELKRGLLQFHCQQFGYVDCTNNSQGYQLVATNTFHAYDTNADELLDAKELTQAEHRYKKEAFMRDSPCYLKDFIILEDRDSDSVLSMSEFTAALGMPSISLEDNEAVFHTTTITGISLQLTCGVEGATDIVWTRYRRILNDMPASEFKILDDGSLYIQEVALQHIGNYSCHDRRWTDIAQTHVLHVQVAPLVQVNPSTQVHQPGSSATLKCHAVGRPLPSIDWQLNEMPLPSIDWWRHILLDENQTLTIRQLAYPTDAGAYKCRAVNNVGASQDIATVFVEKVDVPQQTNTVDLYQVFVIFHDSGYTFYEPEQCHIRRSVTADFEVPTRRSAASVSGHVTGSQLCPPGGACVWGSAVNVRNKFVFASQPNLNRVVVINIRDHQNPVELIATDIRPTDLVYVESLDQVWVMCGNGIRTPSVIRQASEEVTHSIVHPQMQHNNYNPINKIFLPPTGDLPQLLHNGYAFQEAGNQLWKLELSTVKYTTAVNLSDYKCVPETAAFLVIGGKVLFSCVGDANDLQPTCVIVDYVTDVLLPCPDILTGGTFQISPDYGYLVSIKNRVRQLAVFKLDETGWPEYFYDRSIEFEIGNVAFFPSLESRSYDLFAISTNHDSAIHLELETGRIGNVEGFDDEHFSVSVGANKRDKFLTSSGLFGDHLVTNGISDNSVTVLDGRQHRVHCTWQNVSHPYAAVWIEPLRL